MRIFILSDTHFGKYSLDSDKWLNLMKSYFTDFFIPLLEKYSKPNDKLVFLGDLFDNRNAIDMRAINIVVDIFEQISKIIECHILLGNHDQRMMNDPTINSIATIRNIDNIFVYEKHQLVNWDNKSVLLMPWISGKNNEKEILDKYSGTDLLFCHSDLNGCRTQLNPTRPLNRNILDIDDFNGFKTVYSGHIHIVQTINNFTFVGSPYHLDRNDIGNKKGIFVYNTKKDQDIFIPNDFSPEFKKSIIKKESDINELKVLLDTDNFIDIEVSNNLILNNPNFRLEFDKLVNKFKIEKIEYINDIVKEKKVRLNTDYKNKSIKDISFDWIENLKISDKTDLFTEIELKGEMKKTVDLVFNTVQSKKGVIN